MSDYERAALQESLMHATEVAPYEIHLSDKWRIISFGEAPVFDPLYGKPRALQIVLEGRYPSSHSPFRFGIAIAIAMGIERRTFLLEDVKDFLYLYGVVGILRMREEGTVFETVVTDGLGEQEQGKDIGEWGRSGSKLQFRWRYMNGKKEGDGR
ncbi:hypothetical protein MKZ38_007679 [Zalerion maritima]|uniref:Uncharacterized protein n=1 Tax=Zalerion maritima TaxID=339359 RepID=A0AAD5S6G1_9PEZI|nr:hypothetical protein MKZ38_007679 [Zalerion maritima]